ncbi:MAG: hypothetical protein VYA17_10175 [Pseudomonadota bacterium]|nr:hypothetical protein [Pseudomonadota bacterium]
MKKEPISHDHKQFSRMTDILVTQGTGRHSYGIEIDTLGTLALVMNQQGHTNRFGGPLTANTLKQVIYRLRHGDGLDDLAPDWSEFDGPSALHRQASNVINLKSEFSLE